MRGGDAGYTLLELLVATILGTFLIMAITGALQFTGHVSLRMHHSDTDFNDISAAERVVSQTLRDASPILDGQAYADRTIAFDGQADTVRLKGRLPQAASSDQIADETLSVEDISSGRGLYLSWALGLPRSQPDTPVPMQRVRLLDHVQVVRFRYFGRDSDTSEGTWHDSWSGRRTLPGLIKVEIDRGNTTRKSPLELFIEPVVSATPACRFNPEDTACRRVQ